MNQPNTSLDFSQEQFKELLDKSTQLVLEQFSGLEERKAYHYHSQAEVAGWFDEALPEVGMDADQLLQEVRDKVLNTATGNLGPYMYAYVMAGGTQMSIVAEKLAATINQNVGKWHLAPAMNEIEKRVIRWGAEMIGFQASAGGVLTSGGSAANLGGLTVARNIFFEKLEIRKKGLFGMQPFRVYASEEVHSCIDKSVEMLGMGSDNLLKIPVNDQFQIRLEVLEEQIRQDIEAGYHPFCLVGNAGTVSTGAIDDLEGLARLAEKYQMWFHIDGAYGGLAAALPELKAAYRGLEKADSIAVDFHKWLYQPFEAGCLLVKDYGKLKNTYFKKAAYLDAALEQDSGRLNFNEHYFQLSRNARALKVWMSLKAYGFDRFKAMIRKDIELTRYLEQQIQEAPDFRLKASSPLAIGCFWYTGTLPEDSLEAFNQKLVAALEKDGRVFITGTRLNGEFVLRACLINHRMQQHTVNRLLDVIRDVAAGISL